MNAPRGLRTWGMWGNMDQQRPEKQMTDGDLVLACERYRRYHGRWPRESKQSSLKFTGLDLTWREIGSWFPGGLSQFKRNHRLVEHLRAHL